MSLTQTCRQAGPTVQQAAGSNVVLSQVFSNFGSCEFVTEQRSRDSAEPFLQFLFESAGRAAECPKYFL